MFMPPPSLSLPPLSPSIASEGASRAVTPATTHDEDSFSSTPPGRHDTHYHGHGRHDDKREELMRLLAEVSSSSGGEEEEEEEEEDEDDGEEDYEEEIGE